MEKRRFAYFMAAAIILLPCILFVALISLNSGYSEPPEIVFEPVACNCPICEEPEIFEPPKPVHQPVVGDAGRFAHLYPGEDETAYCRDLYLNNREEGANSVPDRTFPEEFRSDFTMNDRTILQFAYDYRKYAGGDAAESVWTNEHVEELIGQAARREAFGTYGDGGTKFSYQAFSEFPISGKYGAVIGSERPWLEAILLAFGAGHITTIEYGRIVSTHPKINTTTPAEIREMYLEGRAPQFDFLATFSSLEHAGLGRYGDPIDPLGDVKAIQKSRCLLKEGGIFFLGLPLSSVDCLVYNLHRIYGPIRRAMVSRGFELLAMLHDQYHGCESYYQGYLVLRKNSKLDFY